MKPETIGKSAVEKDRCESRPGLCPRHVCQRYSYRPLCFPHKKKINSADYQASIKYLLLTSSWEKLMRGADVRDGRSERGTEHSRHQYTFNQTESVRYYTCKQNYNLNQEGKEAEGCWYRAIKQMQFMVCHSLLHFGLFWRHVWNMKYETGS